MNPNLNDTNHMSEQNNTGFLDLKRKPVQIDFLRFKKAAYILRAVNNHIRQEIIELLEKNERLTVSDFIAQINLPQSQVSQHLAILRSVGLVLTQKQGKFVVYSIHSTRLQQLNKYVNQLTR